MNVFDLSMQRNRAAMLRLLDLGVRVRYFDHHAVSDIPSHALPDAQIDCASDTCTSLLVDRRLGGAFRAWALVGAYGDNLTLVADRLAERSGFGVSDSGRLRRLGEAINYNAYGDDESDVRIAPAQLYTVMARYRDPRDLLEHKGIGNELDMLRRADLQQALAGPAHWQDARASVRVLPDAPWSRRVLGCLGNELANAEPRRAHAVLKLQRSGAYAVSVRAPLVSPSGAHALCTRFGGGGRARAAGIDDLPVGDLDRFIEAFAAVRWVRHRRHPYLLVQPMTARTTVRRRAPPPRRAGRVLEIVRCHERALHAALGERCPLVRTGRLRAERLGH